MSVIVVLALVHFLWQGALVGAIAALAIKLSRSATTRYAIGVVALVVMALAPVATATWLRTLNLAATASNNLTVNPEPLSDPNPGLQVQEPKSTRDLGPGTWDRTVQALRSVQVSPVQARWLFGLWLAGVTLLSLRLTLGWRSAQRLTRVGTSQPRSEILSHADALLRALNIRKAVSVLESTFVHVPMAIGWLKPVVLLPAQSMTGLSIEQIDALIAHELAHIKRHDYLVNLLQSVLETMLFYHPAVWLISRRVRHERELCCDDLAIAVCNNDRVTYASALADMESLRQMAPPVLAANGGSLLERIARILRSRDVPLSEGRTSWIAGATVLVVALLMAATQQMPGSAAIDPRMEEVPAETGYTPPPLFQVPPAASPRVETDRDLATSTVQVTSAPSLDSALHSSAQPDNAPAPRIVSSRSIVPTDCLRFEVAIGGFAQAEFSRQTYVVQPDGTIALPVIGGTIRVAGLSLDDAAEAVRRRLADTGRYREARVQLAVEPPAPVPSPETLFDRAYAEYAASQYARAVESFREYLRQYPTSDNAFKAQNYVADALFAQGSYQAAATEAQEAIKKYPTSPWLPDAYFRLGSSYLELGMKPQARGAFQFIIDNFADHAMARVAKSKLDTIREAPSTQSVQRFPDYHIGPTDVLRVVVNIGGVERSNHSAVVAGDGSVSFSPLKEPVNVRGLTPREARAAIQRSLAVADPSVGASNAEVVVAVVQYRASKIVIRGAVRTPGLLQMTFDRLNLGDAINMAGGLAPNAGDVIRVNRAATKTWEEFRRADLTPTKLVGISLFENDIVDVPVQAKFIVNGYVVTPGEYVWHEGLTLEEALAMAGGVTSEGVKNRVEVRRLDPETKTYKSLNLTKLAEGKDKFEILIQVNDIIIVPKRRL